MYPVCGARVDGRAAVHGVLEDVRRGILTAQLVDEVGGVVGAIGAHRHTVAPGQLPDPVHGGRAFRGATGWSQFAIHDQGVAVLHRDVALAAERHTLTAALAVVSSFRGRVGETRLSLLRFSSSGSGVTWFSGNAVSGLGMSRTPAPSP